MDTLALVVELDSPISRLIVGGFAGATPTAERRGECARTLEVDSAEGVRVGCGCAVRSDNLVVNIDIAYSTEHLICNVRAEVRDICIEGAAYLANNIAVLILVAELHTGNLDRNSARGVALYGRGANLDVILNQTEHSLTPLLHTRAVLRIGAEGALKELLHRLWQVVEVLLQIKTLREGDILALLSVGKQSVGDTLCKLVATVIRRMEHGTCVWVGTCQNLVEADRSGEVVALHREWQTLCLYALTLRGKVVGGKCRSRVENATIFRDLNRVGIHDRHLTCSCSVDILRFEVYKHILARNVDAVERNSHITEHLDTVLDADRGVELVLAVPLGVLLVALNLRQRATLIDREDCKVVTLRKGERHHIADKLLVCVVYQRRRPADAETRVVFDVLRLIFDHIANLLKALLGLLEIHLDTVLGSVGSCGDVVHRTLTTLAERSIFDVYMLKVGSR